MDEAVGHFKAWLRRSTGCRFATWLVKQGRVAYEPYVDVPDVDDLDAGLDIHGARDRSAILLLPSSATRPNSSKSLSRCRPALIAGNYAIVVARLMDACWWASNGPLRRATSAMRWASRRCPRCPSLAERPTSPSPCGPAAIATSSGATHRPRALAPPPYRSSMPSTPSIATRTRRCGPRPSRPSQI